MPSLSVVQPFDAKEGLLKLLATPATEAGTCPELLRLQAALLARTGSVPPTPIQAFIGAHRG